jgi:SAM-dependent methyltransferase
VNCPLCGRSLGPSRMRPVAYAGRQFRYLRCASCRSLVCDPMPDDAVLTAMYGPAYASLTEGSYEIDSPRDTAHVIAFLRQHQSGKIVDFGCGAGDLMRAIETETAWTAVGVEFDPAVATMTRAATGAEVYTYADIVAGRVPPADAVHLGDVLEHLTDLEDQIPRLLGLLRPGGYLLSEGPLQCGPAVFELMIQAFQVFRSSSPVSAPPTHVLQASARGQRAFFRRCGLREIAFNVYEVAWPAPSRLRREDFRYPRTLALYVLRKVSFPFSSRELWGNRYRYAGSIA